MPRFQMVVLTKALDGRREELARWYDTRYIPDHLRIPGFLAGARHDLVKLDGPAPSPDWDFVAIYELEADDPETLIAEARRRWGTDAMPICPAQDTSLTLAVLAMPVAPVRST
jgi:hypothetical protein